MKRIVALYFLLFSLHLGAWERQPIWPKNKMPDTQPHQIAAMTDESRSDGFRADLHRIPYLEWFEKPAKPNGCCMILISGGAYNSCCDVGLIRKWHEELTELGFQCVNFVYRTPRPEGIPVYLTAWEDGQRAVRMVRSQAVKRGFDPEKIGAIGMSAGGHLTLMGVTSSLHNSYSPVDKIDKQSCSVGWGIAIYPAYVLADGGFAPEFSFDIKTAPTLFIHGDADRYSSLGSVETWEKMRAMGVQSELHILATRDHCFQRTASPGTGSYNWIDRIWEFLQPFIGER